MSYITVKEKDNPRVAVIDEDYEFGFRVEFKWHRNFQLVGKRHPDYLTLPTTEAAIRAANAWVMDGKSYEEIRQEFGKGKRRRYA